MQLSQHLLTITPHTVLWKMETAPDAALVLGHIRSPVLWNLPSLTVRAERGDGQHGQ